MNTATATTAPAFTPGATAVWTKICALNDIIPRTGACALIRGQQIAVVRPNDSEQLYALSNYDPFSKAFVLARGIVGDKAGVPKITSPIYKHGFDLRSGECLDEPTVKIPTFQVRVVAGQVELLA